MKTNSKIRYNCFLLLLTFSAISWGQKKDKGPANPYAEQARELVVDGNDYVDEDAFAKAETSYRQAAGLDPSSVSAKYNAGNNYYNNEKYQESIASHIKSAQVAVTKKERHKAYHNLGNAYFQKEEFSAAVEAYKNALRNNPTDDETRYNLQLAKKEEEKNGGGGSGGDDDQEQEDQDQNQEKEKNEENKDGDGDKQEGEDGEEQETDDEGEEKENEGEQEEDEDGKPQDQDKEQPGDKGDEKEKAPQQPQPQQGQLTPQQIQNLLEAMRNEEQKTQEKINARKQKGAKVKTEKDW